jgi:hypothetical protein
MNAFNFSVIVFVFALSGCTKTNTTIPASTKNIRGNSSANVLYIVPVKFTENLKVRDAVRVECQLLTKLSEFIKRAAKPQYSSIELQESKAKNIDVLTVEIVDLPNFKKNIWIGRGGQWVGVKGSLSRQGQKTVSFTAMRSSMGGFLGAYKGTCALLGRCTKTLGADIAGWLKNPLDNAQLGDQ